MRSLALVLILGAIGPAVCLNACVCATSAVCNGKPHDQDGRRFISVARVTSTFPGSKAEFYSLWDAAKGDSDCDFDTRECTQRFVEFQLELFGDRIPALREERMRRAGSMDELIQLAGLEGGGSQHVTVEVEEQLLGQGPQEIEFLQDIGSSCGGAFEAGQRYVLDLTWEPNELRWAHHSCGLTSLVANRGKHLESLRAWRDGETPAPYIAGSVWRDDDDRDDTPPTVERVYLIGENETRERPTDAHGRFIFENLSYGRYQLQVGDSRYVIFEDVEVLLDERRRCREFVGLRLKKRSRGPVEPAR